MRSEQLERLLEGKGLEEVLCKGKKLSDKRVHSIPYIVLEKKIAKKSTKQASFVSSLARIENVFQRAEDKRSNSLIQTYLLSRRNIYFIFAVDSHGFHQYSL